MFKSSLLNSSPWIAAFRRGRCLTELLWPAGCGPFNGVLGGRGTGLFDSARTSTGTRCWITLFRSWVFLLLLDTLTIAALTFPSFPGISCSTLPSFQNALEVESFLRMTMSPTVIEVEVFFPLAYLAIVANHVVMIIRLVFSLKMNFNLGYSNLHVFSTLRLDYWLYSFELST